MGIHFILLKKLGQNIFFSNVFAACTFHIVHPPLLMPVHSAIMDSGIRIALQHS